MEESLFDVDETLVQRVSSKRRKQHPQLLEIENEAAPQFENDSDLDINIDKEIKLTKKTTRARLDEERLLGNNHLKTLMVDGPLHINANAHRQNKESMELLLEFYKAWAHNLFPKAQFEDVLAMIEKLQHKTAVKQFRKHLVSETISSKKLDAGNLPSKNFSPDPVSDHTSSGSDRDDL